MNRMCLLLCDGVLDLDAGVDFDEVVAVLGVDEELGGGGVPWWGLAWVRCL